MPLNLAPLEPRPQVIFLDAVGTLFGVKGSVGEIYGSIARQFGVHTDEALLNQAFFHSFKAAPRMAFPGASQAEIPQKEYAWWEAIAYQTFSEVGVVEQFSNFGEFFAGLYDYFAKADPWFIYDDVRQALDYWQSEGITLAVLSNFDSRLYPVLDALGLLYYFSSVTISTEVGAAKPETAVFQAALAKHGISADRAWHIGDSLREDYEGARKAGIRAFWLNRG
ncbi:HAD-IA family hydrolase [Leptolyngbya ohadii]|uniref:HAD-IA family hydrolase n=1 Tax=Leptolyngbya ohadii TaxID=1962290 RepID=UPI000B5A0A08|nr:HAD family hydrolase [Leptolyngbya ohadii]